MAVQVRPVNFQSMLSQQLPQQAQMKKLSQDELTTTNENKDDTPNNNGNNNNINNNNQTTANATFSFIPPANDDSEGEHMHVTASLEGGKHQEDENYTAETANHHKFHFLPDLDNSHEYFGIHSYPLSNLRPKLTSNSTESVHLRSNQLSGTVTPPHRPPPPVPVPSHQMLHSADPYMQSPLEHYSINSPTALARLPKVQNLQTLNLKKALLTNASGTNLNVYLRGSRRHSLTSTPITELLNSPKLNNSNGSGLADSKHGKLNSKNGNSSGSTTPMSDKKNRLVDQFYNSNRIASPSSRVDLPSALKDHHTLSKTSSSAQILAPLTTPIAERKNFIWKEESVEPKESMDPYSFNDSSFLLSDEVVNHVLNSGGFGFGHDQNQIIDDDDLLNYLLNIDNIIDHRTDGMSDKKKTFEQLDKIMSNISDKTLAKSRAILFPSNRNAPDALKELERIQNYLEDLKISTDELAHTLSSNQDNVTSSYKHEIHENVTRLSQVSDELQELERKSDMFKNKIKQQKSNNMNKMMENLDMLDEINQLLKKRTDINKQRLIIKINVFLGIVVLLVSIYYGYKGE